MLYILDKKENFLILDEEPCLEGKDGNNGKEGIVINSEFLNLIQHNDDTPRIYDLVNNYYYLIITEDIKGTTYNEFIMTNISNKTLILNTLFDIIYGIYIMNDKLKIYHTV